MEKELPLEAGGALWAIIELAALCADVPEVDNHILKEVMAAIGELAAEALKVLDEAPRYSIIRAGKQTSLGLFDRFVGP